MPYKDQSVQLEYSRNRHRERNDLINELKSVPCMDCGQIFPSICMDFDHVREGKITSVARMVRNTWSMEKIKAEIAKCEIVCANCHRIRTSNRLRSRFC